MSFSVFLSLVCVVFLAWRFGPPELTTPPDPTIIQAYPRPDWYLLWYFAVLAQLPHGTEAYVIVGAPLLAGICLLILPLVFNRGQRAPSRRPWAVVSIVLIVMVGVLWFEGERAPWSPDFGAKPLSAAVVHAPIRGARRRATLSLQRLRILPLRRRKRRPSRAGSHHRCGAARRAADHASNPERRLQHAVFASSLKPEELNALVAFLNTRKLAR